MELSRRYVPSNFRFFTMLLRHSYGRYLALRYNARSSDAALIRALQPPYVLVANHAMLVDPFLINYYVPQPVHWVAADGNMRNPVLRFFLIKLVGSIPKSKAIPDMETVNWIVRIIRKQKGIVGFFPEGQTTWNGLTMPSMPASAKLLKLLKAPVLCCVSKGAYSSKPRWAYHLRRSKVELTFRVICTPQDLSELSVEAIDERLRCALSHDDPAWLSHEGLSLNDRKRAESLELALYVCPACASIGMLESTLDTMLCRACGFKVSLDRQLRFGRPSGSLPENVWAAAGLSRDNFFTTIAEWDTWQADYMAARMREESPNAVMCDRNVTLRQGWRMKAMLRIGKGSMTLYPDRLVFELGNNSELSFQLSDIEGAGVLKHNYLEFYSGKHVYQVRYDKKNISARKWADAISFAI